MDGPEHDPREALRREGARVTPPEGPVPVDAPTPVATDGRGSGGSGATSVAFVRAGRRRPAARRGVAAAAVLVTATAVPTLWPDRQEPTPSVARPAPGSAGGGGLADLSPVREVFARPVPLPAVRPGAPAAPPVGAGRMELADGCLVARIGQKRPLLAWPEGSTAVLVGGVVEVHDRAGDRVARVGDDVPVAVPSPAGRVGVDGTDRCPVTASTPVVRTG